MPGSHCNLVREQCIYIQTQIWVVNMGVFKYKQWTYGGNRWGEVEFGKSFHSKTEHCSPILLSSSTPVLLSSCPPVLQSSFPPVLLSSCPPVTLSSCHRVLLSSYMFILLSSCPPVCLFSCPSVLLSVPKYNPSVKSLKLIYAGFRVNLVSMQNNYKKNYEKNK